MKVEAVPEGVVSFSTLIGALTMKTFSSGDFTILGKPELFATLPCKIRNSIVLSPKC